MIGFVKPQRQHRPLISDIQTVLGSQQGQQSRAPPLPGHLQPRNEGAPAHVPVVVSQAKQTKLIMSATLSGAGCKKMYETRRHKVATAMLNEALEAGNRESGENVQDLLDNVAADPSDTAITQTYLALLRQYAIFFPCTASDCDLAEQRMLHDLLYLQGVCLTRCDPERDLAKRVDVCTAAVKDCLRGVNKLLAMMQPAACSSMMLVQTTSHPIPEAVLQEAVARIKSDIQE